MDNPYRIDPERLKTASSAQELKLVTVKDDSTRPPATIGAQSWQNIYFGAAAMQPSKASGDIKPGKGKRVIRILFWILVAVFIGNAVMKLVMLLFS